MSSRIDKCELSDFSIGNVFDLIRLLDTVSKIVFYSRL